MTWVNFSDAEAQILAAGILPDKDLAIDGRIQRWKTDDSKGNEKPGWTRLREWQSKAGHLYVVGCFGIWVGTHDGYTKIELPKKDDDPQRPALTDEDIAAAREAQKAAAKAIADERKREAKVAAGWAAQVWAACAPAVEHEYLTRKQIPPSGARQFDGAKDLRLPGIDDGNAWRLQKSAGALVVPMHDTNGNVCGIQFIFPAGHERTGKEFWPTGMAMGGSFGIIGHLRRNGVLLLTEGFATAASLAAATGQAVAYAFSANNLGKTAKEIRAKYKQLRILICADDDYLTEAKLGTNPGVSAAQMAASAIELADWIKPDFVAADGTDMRNGKKLTDYNDLQVLTGLPLVLANQINAKLDALKWKDALPVAQPGNQGGGGRPVADGRRGAMSIMPVDALVERFHPVDDGSGKVVFDQWTGRIVQKTQMLDLLPPGTRPDDIKRHPMWLERGSVYVDQIGFDPAGEDKNVMLNTWRGWPMRPKAGSCDKLLDLIWHLCSRESDRPDIMEWLLRWMAYPLQYPGAKMQSAIMVHGEQGTGKSTVFRVYAELFGYRNTYQNYAVVIDQRSLESKYNSDWDSKCFVLAEEVVNSADKWQLKNELKELVTGDRIRIEKKFLDAYYQANRCNIVFLSNEDQPLPLENKDRRHLVIYTPPALELNQYADIREEMDGGGIEAFYHYLMSIDLTGFKPWAKPPMTEAKQALIDASRSTEDVFFDDWFNGETEFPVCPCRGNDLYAAYVLYCQHNRDRNIASRSRFRLKLAHMHDWGHRKQMHVFTDCHFTSTTRQVRLEVPGDKLITQSPQKIDYRLQPSEKQSMWATRCMLAFETALENATPGLRAA